MITPLATRKSTRGNVDPIFPGRGIRLCLEGEDPVFTGVFGCLAACPNSPTRAEYACLRGRRTELDNHNEYRGFRHFRRFFDPKINPSRKNPGCVSVRCLPADGPAGAGRGCADGPLRTVDDTSRNASMRRRIRNPRESTTAGRGRFPLTGCLPLR